MGRDSNFDRCEEEKGASLFYVKSINSGRLLARHLCDSVVVIVQREVGHLLGQ